MSVPRRVGQGIAVATVLAAIVATLSTCTDQKERYPGLSEAAARGWKSFSFNCLSCHADPNADSPTGPIVAGASLELLRAKVLERTYPAGYAPRRPGTITMPTFPWVENALPDLHAFLAEVRRFAPAK